MLTVVIFDDTAQLLAAFDVAFECRPEINVKNVVADILPPVRATSIVIMYPRSVDVVKMIHAEAKEIVKALTFQRANKRLTECVWRCNQLHLMGTVSHELFV